MASDYGSGRCPVCTGTFRLTKAGNMRHHLGDEYDGRWRQMCKGVGQPPKAEAQPKTPVDPDPVDPSSPYLEVPGVPPELLEWAFEKAAEHSACGCDHLKLAVMEAWDVLWRQGEVEMDEGVVHDAVTSALPYFLLIGAAAGRAQAAADIRAHMGPDPSPASPTWWAGYTEALSDCARIAEGDPSKDLPTELDSIEEA